MGNEDIPPSIRAAFSHDQHLLRKIGERIRRDKRRAERNRQEEDNRASNDGFLISEEKAPQSAATLLPKGQLSLPF